MKKTLLALAVLGAYAGVASAQSSVTIWGVVDLSINQIKNGNVKGTQMMSNQLNSNRLGFRGVEDLGGGLSAGFHLEAPMSNQDGNPGALNFTRRSTVSLISQQGGEVRFGRDYDPSFWNLVFFDVYGANGIGQGLNLITNLGSGATTIARTNNSIGYILPGNLGGVYGQAQYALGQGNDNNKYYGLRGGYAAGPIDVALGYGVTETTSVNKFKIMNVGASWNFGAAKLFGLYNQNKWGSLKENFYEISVSVPLGQGEFKAGYAKVDDKGTSIDTMDANQWALQYIYNMSKRTALYGGYAQLSNKAGSARTIQSGSLGSTGNASLLGGKSKGFNVGVRHSF